MLDAVEQWQHQSVTDKSWRHTEQRALEGGLLDGHQAQIGGLAQLGVRFHRGAEVTELCAAHAQAVLPHRMGRLLPARQITRCPARDSSAARRPPTPPGPSTATVQAWAGVSGGNGKDASTLWQSFQADSVSRGRNRVNRARRSGPRFRQKSGVDVGDVQFVGCGQFGTVLSEPTAGVKTRPVNRSRNRASTWARLG
ncbi:hypothetical protein SHKM778_46240 [Streptomyces sp. KM77-8]|uniref:Uncharacterized protein n=1 Tax=Streptomyces haneummycinicus TaxID=3074435 RepID=A0AAT9HL49_9ACTN